MQCTDLWQNSLGDGFCGMDLGGNFRADPQFCSADPTSDLNLTIQRDSPCASGGPGATCGLIGAAPVGCEGVAVMHRTWSEMKRLYR